MYNHYFGFSEAPFSIAPDPRYLYLSDQHREALAHLLYGIGDHGGFVVLTGEVGTGKTTVCRCLLQQLPDHVDVAVVVNPRLSAHELLQTICEELGVAVPEEPSDKQLIDGLNEFLLATHARGRNAILIVDEAQNLPVEVLEQLRLLTNLETNERKLLQLILLGQPELNELLARPELRQLSQRITARYHLHPLSGGEVASYIEHRLAIAGRRGGLFQPAAVRLVTRLSHGIPRLINLLCDRSLLGVYASSGSAVSAAMVWRAAREVLPQRRRRALRWPLLGAVAALAALVGWWLLPSAPVATTVVQDTAVDWRGQLGGNSEQLAQAALYRLWGETPPEQATCPAQLPSGRSCLLLRQLTLDALKRYNRPAVLLLNDGGGVLLAQLAEGVALLRAGEREWRVPWPEVAPHWSGEAQLLVAAPVAQLPLRPGDGGALVAWLEARLQRLFHGGDQRWEQVAIDGDGKQPEGAAGKPARLGTQFLAPPERAPATTYGAELVAEVKRFQSEHALAGDGVVDLDTVLALSRIVDHQLPSLSGSIVQRGG